VQDVSCFVYEETIALEDTFPEQPLAWAQCLTPWDRTSVLVMHRAAVKEHPGRTQNLCRLDRYSYRRRPAAPTMTGCEAKLKAVWKWIRRGSWRALCSMELSNRVD